MPLTIEKESSFAECKDAVCWHVFLHCQALLCAYSALSRLAGRSALQKAERNRMNNENEEGNNKASLREQHSTPLCLRRATDSSSLMQNTNHRLPCTRSLRRTAQRHASGQNTVRVRAPLNHLRKELFMLTDSTPNMSAVCALRYEQPIKAPITTY